MCIYTYMLFLCLLIIWLATIWIYSTPNYSEVIVISPTQGMFILCRMGCNEKEMLRLGRECDSPPQVAAIRAPRALPVPDRPHLGPTCPGPHLGSARPPVTKLEPPVTTLVGVPVPSTVSISASGAGIHLLEWCVLTALTTRQHRKEPLSRQT